MGNKIILQKLKEELDLEHDDEDIGEQELLDAIAIRVGNLMDADSQLLFSYLYRLDVSERSLNAILSSTSEQSLPERIAILILERQKSRILSKQKYNSGSVPEGWEW